MRKRNLILGICIISVSLMLTACGDTKTDDEHAVSSTNTAVQTQGQDSDALVASSSENTKETSNHGRITVTQSEPVTTGNGQRQTALSETVVSYVTTPTTSVGKVTVPATSVNTKTKPTIAKATTTTKTTIRVITSRYDWETIGSGVCEGPWV